MEDSVAVSPQDSDSEVEEPKKKIEFGARIVEEAIIEHAYNLLKENHINKDHVDIQISYDLGNALSSVFSGHKIKFVISWHAKMQINSVVKDFCRLYYRKNLRRTMEVVPYAWINEEAKKWKKELFTSEEQIIFDLLPKRRLEIVEKEVITISDSVTGETISIERSAKKKRFDGDNFELWVAISRRVLSKEHD